MIKHYTLINYKIIYNENTYNRVIANAKMTTAKNNMQTKKRTL